jgi:glucose dehydrogenase
MTGQSATIARLGLGAAVVGSVFWLSGPVPAVRAQQPAARTTHGEPAPSVNRATSRDWPLHHHDLGSVRYVDAAEITAANVAKVTERWSFKPSVVAGTFGLPDEAASSTVLGGRNSLFQQTPIVVDGVMYVHSGSNVYALNAVTGAVVWHFAMPPFVGEVRQRGPAYGDGRIYAHGPHRVYALDAKSGKLVESFGKGGLLNIVGEALHFKYPDLYPEGFDATRIGFELTGAAVYHNGTLYMGTGFGDAHTPGGFMMAVDGATGRMKWVFNTIPQRPGDDGWELAKDTWTGGARAGGGVWTPPTIDAELGLIYFNAGNPSPDFDGSARHGINLFSNAIVALDLATGKLRWFFQGIHHEIWDQDFMTTPVLMDVTRDGKTIKAVATSGKVWWPFIFNRETGEPLNPIVETPVPTATDVPNERPWPTQPMPHNARGELMAPFCFTYPIVTDPKAKDRVRTMFHPLQANSDVIIPNGSAGFGGMTFSPRTGLLYVRGTCGAGGGRVRPVGDTLKPGPGPDRPGFMQSRANAQAGNGGVRGAQTISAYDPITGEQIWRTDSLNGPTGLIATAADLIFQVSGLGEFAAYDATSGKQVARFGVKGTTSASPLMYQVNGRQFIAVVANDTVRAYALP